MLIADSARKSWLSLLTHIVLFCAGIRRRSVGFASLSLVKDGRATLFATLIHLFQLRKHLEDSRIEAVP